VIALLRWISGIISPEFFAHPSLPWLVVITLGLFTGVVLYLVEHLTELV
jgi:hypothetical protein